MGTIVAESLLIQTLRGRRGSRPPIWFMRQAGRYLPEYREIRAKHSMLEIIKTPKLAAEVSLQPLRRFDLDAAIIFADILNPLIGMGLEVDFVAGQGPRIFNPLRSAADVAGLKIPQVIENSGYTLEAIELVVSELDRKGVPLIGFCGAPFTLSCYMIEGCGSRGSRGSQGSQDFSTARTFWKNLPEAWRSLQLKLVELCVDYLAAQAGAGAAALQIFDSWLGLLNQDEYVRLVEPYLKKMISLLKQRTNVPLVFYSTGTSDLLGCLSELGVDGLGVDGSLPLSEAARRLALPLPLQGNLDQMLLAGEWEPLECEVFKVLEEGQGLLSHIFNVGRGILPHTPPDNVARVVEIVRAWNSGAAGCS
ncbi:MAG: uroporphyrinogen decarboxylase [Deltaproteobacteria bacterium]|nr:uroporphyrinogen decarboxylase [Deltaproteobacteria bacterium]